MPETRRSRSLIGLAQLITRTLILARFELCYAIRMGGVVSQAFRKAVPIIVALAVMSFSAWCAYVVIVSGNTGNDFRVYWSVAGSNSPYAPTDWPFSYPPTMLLWIEPLAWFQFWPAFAIWSVLSATAYAAAVRVGTGWPYALLAFPGTFALVTGQVSLIVAAIMFTAFRSRWSGMLLGVAFTIKPQLAFLAPLALLLIRDLRQLAMMAATVAVICLLATALFGLDVWPDWLGSFGHFQRRAEEIGVLGAAASPAALALYIGLNPLPFVLAGLLAGCAVLLIAFKDAQQKGALLALCCLLGSPYALAYDLVAIMPLAVPHLVKRLNWRTVPAALTATFGLQLLGMILLAAAEVFTNRCLRTPLSAKLFSQGRPGADLSSAQSPLVINKG